MSHPISLNVRKIWTKVTPKGNIEKWVAEVANEDIRVFGRSSEEAVKNAERLLSKKSDEEDDPGYV